MYWLVVNRLNILALGALRPATWLYYEYIAVSGNKVFIFTNWKFCGAKVTCRMRRAHYYTKLAVPYPYSVRKAKFRARAVPCAYYIYSNIPLILGRANNRRARCWFHGFANSE